MSAPHHRWSSRVAFIFAAASAAIGLGNVWRFPYMLGQHGGGAFVLMYIGCVILLGVPLLTAEVVLGRLGRQNPASTMREVALLSNRSKHWYWAGAITVLAGFLILSYYVVIVGWVLDYVIRILLGEMTHMSETLSAHTFHDLQNNFTQMLLTTTVVILAAIGILYLGLKNGLERAVMLMFPALIILLILLIGYAMTTGHFEEALAYLFKPDMHEVTAKTFLLALGQAFFSLNVAMGITMMFSAYLPDKVPLVSSVIAISIADTIIALLSGMVIFPIVFSNHLSPSTGPSLIFQTLPIAFGHIYMGQIMALLFFVMLFFAAFSSVLAMMEPSVRWLSETTGISRHKSSWCVGIAAWIVSLGTIMSFTHKKLFHHIGFTFFQIIDNLTATVMLPVGGLLIATFTGWFLSKPYVATQLNWETNGNWFSLWRLLLRYVAPLAILLILLGLSGLL